jgi:hypothetical protein
MMRSMDTAEVSLANFSLAVRATGRTITQPKGTPW